MKNGTNLQIGLHEIKHQTNIGFMAKHIQQL